MLSHFRLPRKVLKYQTKITQKTKHLFFKVFQMRALLLKKVLLTCLIKISLTTKTHLLKIKHSLYQTSRISQEMILLTLQLTLNKINNIKRIKAQVWNQNIIY